MAGETDEDLSDAEVLAELWARHFDARSEHEHLRNAIGDPPTAEEERQLAISWDALEAAIRAVEAQMALIADATPRNLD
ncbi:MAG: hypothetical protein DWI48_00735 [Chloroflexi bacterium]|nr:MAG: hypothetical protein DWI48_00735 [Chloroflexota bacterium]